jgi:hypothetical protein
LDLVFPVEHDAVDETYCVAPRDDWRKCESDEYNVDLFGVVVVEIEIPLGVELLVLFMVLPLGLR